MFKYVIIESEEPENAAKICYPAENMDEIIKIIIALIENGSRFEDLEISVINQVGKFNKDGYLVPPQKEVI